MKKYNRVLSHNTKECPKFGEKLALASKNDRNLVNFNVNCEQWQAETLHFNMLLFSIAYNVLAKKVQENYLP